MNIFDKTGRFGAEHNKQRSVTQREHKKSFLLRTIRFDVRQRFLHKKTMEKKLCFSSMGYSYSISYMAHTPVITVMTSNSSALRVFFMASPSSISTLTIWSSRTHMTRLVMPSASTRTAS